MTDPQHVTMELLEQALGSQGRQSPIQHPDHLNAMLRDLDAQRRFLGEVERLHTKRGEAAETAQALSSPDDTRWILALRDLKDAHDEVARVARDEALQLDRHPLCLLRQQLELISAIPWSCVVRIDSSFETLTVVVRGDGLQVFLADRRPLVTEFEVDGPDDATTIVGARVHDLVRVAIERAVWPIPGRCPPTSPRLDHAVIA